MQNSSNGPAIRPRGTRAGFTLAELLVVMGIIGLILAMAVPAFNYVTGARSLEAAENQIAAMLCRARDAAMARSGRPGPVGVAFFRDRDSDRITMVVVRQDPASGKIQPIEDSEFRPLPAGVGMQMIGDDKALGFIPLDLLPSWSRASDRAKERRAEKGKSGVTPSPHQSPPGWDPTLFGLVLFDARGSLVQRPFVVPDEGLIADRAGVIVDEIGWSKMGLALYEREAFENQTEDRRDAWLDERATVLLVNRYNGKLIRGK